MKNFNMDEVEDMMDDMQDLMADQEDIQEMMSRNFGMEYDEGELEAELAELDEELISDQLNEGLGLPSYIPQKADANGAGAQKVDNKPSEENQLENMMQI